MITAALYIELRLRFLYTAVVLLSSVFRLMKRKIRFCPIKDIPAKIVNKLSGKLEVDFSIRSEMRIITVSNTTASIITDTVINNSLPLPFRMRGRSALSELLVAITHLFTLGLRSSFFYLSSRAIRIASYLHLVI